jgi:hypothetical protein
LPRPDTAVPSRVRVRVPAAEGPFPTPGQTRARPAARLPVAATPRAVVRVHLRYLLLNRERCGRVTEPSGRASPTAHPQGARRIRAARRVLPRRRVARLVAHGGEHRGRPERPPFWRPRGAKDGPSFLRTQHSASGPLLFAHRAESPGRSVCRATVSHHPEDGPQGHPDHAALRRLLPEPQGARGRRGRLCPGYQPGYQSAPDAGELSATQRNRGRGRRADGV